MVCHRGEIRTMLLNRDCVTAHAQELDDAHLEERLYSMSMEDSDDMEHFDGYMTLILRVMGQMCDGQHSEHQVWWQLAAHMYRVSLK